jgi:uncharacterized membrane protein
MPNKNVKIYLAEILILSTFLGGLGQLLFKAGLLEHQQINMALAILAGLVAYGVSTLLYFYALGREHLSWVYGFSGLSYIFTWILAYLFLGEATTTLGTIGILLIATGVALAGTS